MASLDGAKVYLITVKELFVAERKANGTFGPLQRLIDNLPDAGQHADRTIVVGKDGMLYISVGSTCNACDESNAENATMLRVKPDGSARTVYASGLRNTIGFAFHPTTNALFGFDHGIDWLGDDDQRRRTERDRRGAPVWMAVHLGRPQAQSSGRAAWRHHDRTVGTGCRPSPSSFMRLIRLPCR